MKQQKYVHYPVALPPSDFIMEFSDAALSAIDSIGKHKFINWCKEQGELIRPVELTFLDEYKNEPKT